MKLTVRPELKPEPGEWEVYRVISESEPGLYHLVAVQYDLECQSLIPPPDCNCDDPDCYQRVPIDWVCSCKGFNYKKTCWHIQELGCDE